jgi:hypothetical protein
MEKFSRLFESPVGSRGRTSVKDAHAHITPELEKEFFKIVKKLGGKTVASVLLNKITVAPIGTSDSVLKRYQDSNHIQSDRLKKSNKPLKENTMDINENVYEDILIKHNIKIKSKFETKFGTEFQLAKKYDEDNIRHILNGYKVTFDGNSIFVTK